MSENSDIIWSTCLELISKSINDDLIFDNFYSDSKLDSFTDKKVIIIVNSIIAKHHFNTNINIIRNILNQVTGSNYECEIMTEEERNTNTIYDHTIKADNPIHSDNLIYNFNFSSFVVGASNQEAFQASLSVANKPGSLFNPLFIYGHSGLGKTHVAHSIGNRIKEQKPNMRILYVTSEEFFSDYISLVNSLMTTDSFNNKYRDIDVLIVDDIQFLGNKEKSNEMFFNVYNDLFSKNKQIIITSDVMPKELHGLEQRLVSRFYQGLSVGIDPPEYDTCIKILKSKITHMDENLSITDSALDFIAKHFAKDVRDLEGGLRRVIFHAINMNNTSVIDKKSVDEAFKDYQFEKIVGNITPEKILKIVCSYYNLSKNQITGKSRQKIITTPRHIAIYLTRVFLETPYEKIGRVYGNRDHSTIMSSYHKVKEQVDLKNRDYISVINEISELLKS